MKRKRKEDESVYSLQNSRLAQPVKKKGRPSKGVNKVGSFSLNKYLAKGGYWLNKDREMRLSLAVSTGSSEKIAWSC